jgi:tRNA A37 threonylcarbamoyladenosine biosynthesis protein TsaE
VSTLVVSFPVGEEIRLLIANFELENTVFRSDHASNYLVLKGDLGADKERLLKTIDMAINKPGTIPLRQEWQRGL